MRDAARHLFKHGTRAVEVFGAAADQREQFAVADLRNSPEHRRFDQSRALGIDQRREFAPGHRLQRAHFDEQLALYVGGEKAVRAGENAAHAVIFRDDGDDDLGLRGNLAGIGRDPQSARREASVRVGIVIPARHLETLLAQPLRHCRAHSA